MYETHDKRALLLPNVTVADAGKVLAVDDNGKLSLEAPESELPEVESTDAGKVLTVSDEGEWEAAPIGISGLPEVSVSDAGDVLTVNASGEWEAASPSGGGLTLYGPYFATLPASDTIAPGNVAEKMLSSIYDGPNEVVCTTEHMEFILILNSPLPLVSYCVGSLVDGGIYSPPVVTIYCPEGESMQPSISLTNENLGMLFMSTVEFTPVSQGD